MIDTQISQPDETSISCSGNTDSIPVRSTPHREFTILGYADTVNVLAAWEELEAELAIVPIACSYEWTRTWIENYGDLIPYNFFMARENGRVCGLCLITQGFGQMCGPFHVKTIHFGTAGEPEIDSVCVEYNGFLVDPECRTWFIEALVASIDRHAGWEEFHIDGFEAADCTTIRNAVKVLEVEERPSFYFDLTKVQLPDSDIISLLGRSTRGTLRYNLRAYSDLKLEWAESIDQADAIFDDMARLHQARWTAAGELGAYASSRFTAFHRDLYRRLLPGDRVGLMRVTTSGDIVGCVEVLIDRNRALKYQSGTVSYAGPLSPGMVVDYMAIQECKRRGFDAFDFGAGDLQHKRRLSTDCNNLYWGCQQRKRLATLIVQAARRIKKSL